MHLDQHEYRWIITAASCELPHHITSQHLQWRGRSFFNSSLISAACPPPGPGSDFAIIPAETRDVKTRWECIFHVNLCVGAYMHACMHTERPAYSPSSITPALGESGGESKVAQQQLNRGKSAGELYLTVPGRMIAVLWDHIFHLYHSLKLLKGIIVSQFSLFVNLFCFFQRKQIKPHKHKLHENLKTHIPPFVVNYSGLLKLRVQGLFGKDLSCRLSLLDQLIKTT